MKKRYIVFIPARGGSKGIPLKNIKKFINKPLIEYSIDYAKQSKKVNDIILSTDNKDIKKIALKNNITVIDRPNNISGDKASTESAIQHLVNSQNFDNNTVIILLQPTSPLRPKNTLDLMLNKFKKNRYDCMLTLSPIHPLTWKININLKSMYDYSNRPRRQDFKEEDMIYDENGSVYIFTVKSFLKYKNRLGGKIGHYVFEEIYGKQIDTPLDFEILETIARYIDRNENEKN